MDEVSFRDLVESWQHAHNVRHDEWAVAHREAIARTETAIVKLQHDLADLRHVIDNRLGSFVDRDAVEARIHTVQAWSDRVHVEQAKRLEALEAAMREQAGREAGSHATWQAILSIATLAVGAGVLLAKLLGI